jgi:hypothetical protein
MMSPEVAAAEYVTETHRAARMRVRVLSLRGLLSTIQERTPPSEVERVVDELLAVEAARRDVERRAAVAWLELARAFEVPVSTEPCWRTFVETLRWR